MCTWWIYGLTAEHGCRHGAAGPCICVHFSHDVPVGRRRLGFSTSAPVSGKPCMGHVNAVLLVVLVKLKVGRLVPVPGFPFSVSQPAPTQNGCYLGNSRRDFPLHTGAQAHGQHRCSAAHTGSSSMKSAHWNRLTLVHDDTIRPNLLDETTLTGPARPPPNVCRRV